MKFSSSVFEVKNLCLLRNKQDILKNVSFTIFKGDYIALIGPNGGGKSTLVKTLLKLISATSGTIKILGQNQSKFNAWDKIGYVPQRASLLDDNFPASVLDVVKMGLIVKNKHKLFFNSSFNHLLDDAMKKMNVLHLKDRQIGELSGGQRQRVMIARALVSKPEVLILDEPNTGVDAKHQKDFYVLLKKLNKDEKITIIFITHDIGVIADDIDGVMFINSTLRVSKTPTKDLSCNIFSKVYGFDAHMLTHRGKHV